MPCIKRTLQANEDLIEVWEYIHLQNPAAAEDETVHSLHKACLNLAYFPHSAPLREEFGEEVRCHPVKNYVLLYKPLSDGILLLRVVHCARYLPGLI